MSLKAKSWKFIFTIGVPKPSGVWVDTPPVFFCQKFWNSDLKYFRDLKIENEHFNLGNILPNAL